MASFPALDVAIGLILVFFLLSVIVSAINEVIASRLNWRARDLEKGIQQLLGDHESTFRAHPLIKSLIDPSRAKKVRYPSYIPSRTFVTALLGRFGDPDSRLANPRELEETLRKIPNSEVREALTALYHHAQADAVEFRKAAERWFDDAMERVSGWYRRRVQRMIIVLSAALVLVINADSLQMAKHLWTNPAARETIANSASNATEDPGGKEALKELRALPLPLGWHWNSSRHDAQGFPVYASWSAVFDFVSKLIGLGLTTAALLLGAPFWFDTLSKLARLRNSGAPPPATDSVREGEAEATRGAARLVVETATPPTGET